MADRGAEQGGAISLADREQGDLQLEAQEFLHDHPFTAASGTGDRCGPGSVEFFGTFDHALPFAGGAHHRLHHHGEAQWSGGGFQFLEVGGIGKPGRAQTEFIGGQVADAVAVHGDRRGPGRGDHLDAVVLQGLEGIHSQGFDLRNHHVRPVAAHHVLQERCIGHGEDFRLIGHLHGRGAGIAVTGDHPATQALGCNHHFLTQFAAAQQHHGFREHGHGWPGSSMVRSSRFAGHGFAVCLFHGR